MEQDITFIYNYSAKDNREVLEIRKKYLPQQESKLDELKRLDRLVQSSGVAESLCIGTSGLLVFGLGLCFAMQIIGTGAWGIIPGVLLTIVGMAGIVAAYPVYRSVFCKTKAKYTPRILALAAELSNDKPAAI